MSKDTAQRPSLWRRFLGQSPEKEAGSPGETAPADEAPPPPAQKAETEAAQAEAGQAAPESWWQRLKKGLRRSSSGLSASVGDLFTKRKLDAETLEEFEDALLRADLGVDTAGRQQNRAELMGELEKILRVIRKIDASAPHAVLLVLDATVGQNALSQVEIFQKTAGVTGLVMTKLDGTARGGILVAIAQRFGLPVHLIGVGEGVEDLEAFSARDFANALAGLDEPAVP